MEAISDIIPKQVVGSQTGATSKLKLDSRSLVTDSDVFGFRVRPVENPQNRTGNSAHFYTDNATSTFLVVRDNHTVFALERGKNEVPSDSDSFITEIRNKLVAFFEMIGLSKPQWQKLMDRLLDPVNQQNY